MNANFDNLDLRSLRMLKVLLETRSATKAGEAVAISQPAASRVLAKLRLALGDPLLVRGRYGNTLTPRGELLRPVVAEALHTVSAVFEDNVFDPSSTSLSVRIATMDHGAAVLLVPLVQALATLAPGITLEVTPWSAQTLSDLETGRLDLALDVESRLPEELPLPHAVKEKYACLVRQGHPLLKALRSVHTGPGAHSREAGCRCVGDSNDANSTGNGSLRFALQSH